MLLFMVTYVTFMVRTTLLLSPFGNATSDLARPLLLGQHIGIHRGETAEMKMTHTLKGLQVLLLLFAAACTTTTTTTVINDTGRQAVLYETSRAPHMRGPGLHAGESEVTGNYSYSLGPEAKGTRLPGQDTAGGAVAEHMWDVRFTTAMNTPDNPDHLAWEFGINLALTHSSLSKAQSTDFSLTYPNQVYLRAGFGFRGPVFQRRRFSLGMNFEMDMSALPYHVQVIRSTEQITNVVGRDFLDAAISTVFLGKPKSIETYRVNGQEFTADTEIDSGHAFFPTFRTGLYGNYHFNDWLSVTLGTSIQNTPVVQGIESQSYSCENTKVGTRSDGERAALADKCRDKKGDDFPVIRHAMGLNLYGGLHATFDDVVITLRAQTGFVFGHRNAYTTPIGADIEIGYRF
jgi:hypothetical protein